MVLQPVLPYIEYFAFKDFITKNLCVDRNVEGSCCKGKCYLEKKIKESNTDNPNKETTPLKVKTEYLTFYIPSVEHERPIFIYKICYRNRPETDFLNPFITSVFHPPQSV